MVEMKVYGTYKNKTVSKTVYSKIQAYAIINQMRKDGITDIRCSFEELDRLP